MAQNLDQMILAGGTLFNEYRNLHVRATASTNTRANQLAEIEEHQRQIRLLTEENALERERADRMERRMRRILEKMKRNGHVVILREEDNDVLDKLNEEEGYLPRIFCPLQPLRHALREKGFDPYPFP